MKRIVAQRKVAHALLGVFILLGAALAAWYWWPDQRTSETAANKLIEIQAAEEKNPAKCSIIEGASYTYDNDNQKLSITEYEARELCRENITKGIIPKE